LKLYKFYKDDCIPCRNLSKIMSNMTIPSDIEIINLDVKDPKNREYIDKYKIQGVPTLVKDSGESLVGFQSTKAVAEFIGIGG
jgi:thiol-disulfide isomerase/thioredoxin